MVLRYGPGVLTPIRPRATGGSWARMAETDAVLVLLGRPETVIDTQWPSRPQVAVA